jgi:hypothetical protein
VEERRTRHTSITRLGVADDPLTVTQGLARHSTPNLTASFYTHVGLADQQSALARAFDPKPADRLGLGSVQATGTDGGSVGTQAGESAQRYAQRESDLSTLNLAGAGTKGAGSKPRSGLVPIAQKSLETQ